MFLENFRPGVAARLGVGYDAIRAVRPDVIYCSVSGFGQDGPLSHKLAYDLIAAGYGGSMSVTGEQGGRPVRPGVPMSDIIAAMAAAYSIALALMTRRRTGEGCYLDIALLDGQLFAMAHHLLAFELTGRVPGRHGSAHPQVAPYQTYRTKTIDINIAVLTEKQWRAFCELLGRPRWLDDTRFSAPGPRNEHRAELEREIEAVLAERPGAEWLDKLEAAGIPCGPINTTEQLVSEPQLEARGMYLDLERADTGRVRLPGAPWRGPGVMERWSPPPDLGEHTDVVLSEVLGATEERLRELRRDGVIAGPSRELVKGGTRA